MYGLAGERRLTELELRLAAGLRGLAPGAHRQRGRRPVPARRLRRGDGRAAPGAAGAGSTAERAPLGAAARAGRASSSRHWEQPDEGIWEVRGPARHFTHSKVMAWVAFDRAVQGRRAVRPRRAGRRAGGALRDEIHDEVCRAGFDAERGTFTQYYGSQGARREPADDAAGRLPAADDERVLGTVEAIERADRGDGFVLRYIGETADVDGLPPGEGAFLPCTFWLADNLALLGRLDEARALFERLLGRQRRRPARGGVRPERSAWSATSRRRSRTWRWSTPRATLAGEPRTVIAARPAVNSQEP